MLRFLKRLTPFIFIGIAIVAFAFSIMILAYLFLFGALIGFVLFIFSYLRNRLFPRKTVVPSQKKTGRIIDTDDWKEL